MNYAIDIEEAVALDSKVQDAVDETPRPDAKPYPSPVLQMSPAERDKLATWIDEWLIELTTAHDMKVSEWRNEEDAYAAADQGVQQEPFVGATGLQVPLIAMAVDPIVARLDTGLFKTAPVFRFKALRKSITKYTKALDEFFEYYQRHVMHLRTECIPRIIELAKHGNMVLKVVYECEEYISVGYDKDWNVKETVHTKRKGPRIVGVPLNRFLFPAYSASLQAAPIVGERLSLTWEELVKGKLSGKFAGIEKLQGQESSNRLDALEDTQATAANHRDSQITNRTIDEIYELWFDYAPTPNKPPRRYAAVYHRPTRTFIQLRYNWYFHQQKPYVIIPYTPSTGSLYALGIAKMVLPLQDTLTQWQRHALNNAYLANIRMFVTQKDAKIEQRPKLFAGRNFPVENPQTDFIAINAAQDIYPSTMAERQNVIGLAEKRTGVSDYLTGRESPIVGSRATATSTLALIQEGTRRVDAVVENIRGGFAEALSMVVDCWIQYGVGDVDDIVFAGDEVHELVNEFFNKMGQQNVNGMFAVELMATDATNSRAAQQQAQLAIIQTMMVYLQKVVEVAQVVTQSAQQSPQLAQFLGEVMDSARHMYTELLTKYEIRNPEEYLPDLDAFLKGLGLGTTANSQAPNPISQGGFDVSALNGAPNASQGVPNPSPMQ
jgi:hypothetical protein